MIPVTTTAPPDTLPHPTRVDRFALSAALVAACSVGWILTHPTEYGISDQVVYLPHIYRTIDSAYQPHDPFLNDGPQHIAFTHLVAGLAHVFPLPRAMYVVRTIQVVLVFSALLFACHTISARPIRTFVFTTLFCNLLLFRSQTGYHFFTSFAGPAALSWPFCLAAFLFTIRSRTAWAAICMTAGALFHPLIGAQTFGAIVTAQMLTWQRRPVAVTLRTTFFLAIAFLAGAMPLIAREMRLPPEDISSEQMTRILCFVRHPHHTILSSFDVKRIARGATPILGVLLCLPWLSRQTGVLRSGMTSHVVGFFAGLIFLAYCGFFGIEYFFFSFFAKIYPYRCLVYFNILGALIAAAILADLPTIFARARHGPLLCKLGMFFPALYVLLTTIMWLVEPQLKDIRFQVIIPIILCLIIVGFRAGRRARVRFTAMALASLAFIVAADRLRWDNELRTRLTTTQWTAMEPQTGAAFDAVRRHVPPDAVVMITPNIFGFRAHAHRTPYFEFKCFPFSAQGAREWFSTFTEMPEQGAPLTNVFDLCRTRTVDYALARFVSRSDRDLYVRVMDRLLSPYGGHNLYINESYALIQFQWNTPFDSELVGNN